MNKPPNLGLEMFAEVQGRLERRFKAQEALLSAKYLVKVGAVYGYAIAVMIYGIAVSGILRVLSYVVVTGGVVGLLGFVLYRIGRFYYRFFWDKVSLAVTLTELILIVWGANAIGKWISWNKIFICIQAVYVFVRMVVTSDRR